MSSFLAILAGGMGAMMAASPIFQLRLIIKQRHSDDVSIAFLAIIVAGACAWTAYGIDTVNWVLIIPNSLGIICASATIITARRFKHPSAS